MEGGGRGGGHARAVVVRVGDGVQGVEVVLGLWNLVMLGVERDKDDGEECSG